jgi:hypothetical protein
MGMVIFMCRSLYRASIKLYKRKVDHYLSTGMKNDYFSYEIFHGRHNPPSGADLRRLYDRAEQSTATPTGISNLGRYNREMQSVLSVQLSIQYHACAILFRAWNTTSREDSLV